MQRKVSPTTSLTRQPRLSFKRGRLLEKDSRPVSHEDILRVRSKAKVWLVGAGPGDPDLLTLRAAKLIRSAEVILHDGLVSPEILAIASPSTLLVNVGKRCGHKNVTQTEVNQTLINFASQGKLVVRLKSGDPLVFGRAGEELEALRGADVEAEVVPGITCALAAAASAQVSLTDRRFADRVVFLSAHCADDKVVDWNGVADARTTVVVYMPGDYGIVSERLITIGMSRETPCLVLSKISSPDQKSYRTDLSRLRGLSAATPSILIIGHILEEVAF
jgi:uroporphyrin-III C-methyltransferase